MFFTRQRGATPDQDALPKPEGSAAAQNGESAGSAVEDRLALAATIDADPDIAKHLRNAVAYAESGDIESEQFSVRQALALTRQRHGKRAAGMLAARIDGLRAESALHSTTDQSKPLTPEQAREAYEREIDRVLEAATDAASRGDLRAEHYALLSARQQSKSYGGEASLREVNTRIGRLGSDGRLTVGSRLLGRVEPEGRIDRSDRTQLLRNLVATKDEPIAVYSDRVIQGDTCWAIDAHTMADVYLDGSRQKVSNRSVSERRNVYDRRTASFSVSGAGWSLQVRIAPDRVDGPRGLANQINMIAGRLAQHPRGEAPAGRSSSDAPTQRADSTIERLERLATLRSTGAITDEEFAVLKGSVLDSTA